MTETDVDRLLEGVSVHDRPDLLARLCDDAEIADEVMGVFFEDVPKQLEILFQSIEMADTALAKRQAHTIKGASGNVAANAMRVVAYEIEKSAGVGDLIEARRLSERLAAEFERLKASLGK